MFLTKSIALLAATAGLVSAAPSGLVQPRRCASEEPSQNILAGLEEIKVNEQRQFRTANEPINVPVNFHVAASSQKTEELSDEVLAKQFEVMRDAFAKYNVNFTFNGTDRIVDDDIATGMIDGSGRRDREQQKAFDYYVRDTRLGDYATLNVYFYTDFPSGLFGLCYFPEKTTTGSDVFWSDGCQINSGTVPGGPIENYNLGHTVTHEVGHWFGLLHVFQGQTCGGTGDQIDDTPVQSTATSGCPTKKDSCPKLEGMDSVHNFMDYSTDAWLVFQTLLHMRIACR